MRHGPPLPDKMSGGEEADWRFQRGEALKYPLAPLPHGPQQRSVRGIVGSAAGVSDRSSFWPCVMLGVVRDKGVIACDDVNSGSESL